MKNVQYNGVKSGLEFSFLVRIGDNGRTTFNRGANSSSLIPHMGDAHIVSEFLQLLYTVLFSTNRQRIESFWGNQSFDHD